ncbi:hypothetical protein [Streptomyces sp. NBC_00094]|uniref:hypothetical protein n=1 Tax=Streptomyces sp. NBC_00094 TaxID=2903620 RepID=UPI00225270A3|nr:hypothetical protein [Streptomyces sp. NBC_00094]MCX5393267.1 hypothetical protein [Streptomyces sp. NBC_00094]
MRFRVTAADAPLTVQFEPSGMEYELSVGEHIDVEWPPVAPGDIAGDIDYGPTMVTIGARGTGYARAWNSEGVEVTT